MPFEYPKVRTGIPVALKKDLISQADLCDRLDCTRFHLRDLVAKRLIKKGPKMGRVSSYTIKSVEAYEAKLRRMVTS